ncbi:MAG TPA: hypothetical protein PL069_05305, partial [Saprospiraceae bacterium]|nr:hypothetical protein [Saprospiraceae bacterium]
ILAKPPRKAIPSSMVAINLLHTSASRLPLSPSLPYFHYLPTDFMLFSFLFSSTPFHFSSS